MRWPALPTGGYIAGGSATVGDVDRGSAVFCQQSDDAEPNQPFDVEVPQYAIWHEPDGAEVPVILVQAECHNTDPAGDAIFRLRTLDGREVIVTSGEVTLLGKQAPAN